MTNFGSVLTLKGLPTDGILKLVGFDPINDPNGLLATLQASISFRSAGIPDGDHRQWLLGTNINYPTVALDSFGITTADLSATPFIISPTNDPTINFIGINNPTPQQSLDVIGAMNLSYDAGLGIITIKSANTSFSNYNFILPESPGSAGQVLTSQGGTLPMTWTSNSGGVISIGPAGDPQTGVITLQSAGSTVIITSPSAGVINFESTGGGGGISALTGDVTASGTGSVVATIAAIQGNTVTGTTGTQEVVFSNSPTMTGILTVPNIDLTAMTAGSVLFAEASGAISQNNANFFWDNVNNRLGIGNNSPQYTLDVTGDINMPATTSSSAGVLYSGGISFLHNFSSSGLSANNTFLGSGAANFTLTGNNNSVLGANAATSLTTGSYNTVLGSNVGNGTLTIGANNILIGVDNTTKPVYNSSVRTIAIGQNTSPGSYDVAIGYMALSANTKDSFIDTDSTLIGGDPVFADSNVAVGYKASANSTGIQYSTAIGYCANAGNEFGPYFPGGSGSESIAIGAFALANTAINANNNIAIGNYAGQYMGVSSNGNIAIGNNALEGSSGSGCGLSNLAIGFGAISGTTGSNNTAIGNYAGSRVTSGFGNTLIGTSTGYDVFNTSLVSGSYNILIGPGNGGNKVSVPTESTSNYINIGNVITSDMTTGNVTISGNITAATSLVLNGTTSGAVTVGVQASAGTYNFELPTTAGTSGQVLTSQGGASAMIWSSAAILVSSAPATSTSVGITGQYYVDSSNAYFCIATNTWVKVAVTSSF